MDKVLQFGWLSSNYQRIQQILKLRALFNAFLSALILEYKENRSEPRHSSEQEINICVVIPNGRNLVYQIKRQARISEIETRVRSKSSISGPFRLFSATKTLQSTKTLEDYNIGEGVNTFLLLSLRGGGRSGAVGAVTPTIFLIKALLKTKINSMCLTTIDRTRKCSGEHGSMFNV